MAMETTIEEVIYDAEKSVFLLQNFRGVGTGFAISPQGHILTCNHVVDTDTVRIVSSIGKSEVAPIWARHPACDLAVVKLDIEAGACMTFAHPSTIRSGQKVYSLGHPLGLDFTVSEGIISNRNRTIKGADYVQTDVPLNPGNSGGPLINRCGEVIGITNRMISLNFAQGLGFATAIRHIFAFAAQLRIKLNQANPFEYSDA